MRGEKTPTLEDCLHHDVFARETFKLRDVRKISYIIIVGMTIAQIFKRTFGKKNKKKLY